MTSKINKDNIRFVEHGDKHIPQTYNQPIDDLIDELESVLEDVGAIEELTQAQVETPGDTAFGTVSGKRLWQAVNKWWSGVGTIFGKGLLDSSDDVAARNHLGLGNSSTRSVGTVSGTVAAGDDSRIIDGKTAHSWGNHASAGYVKTDTTYSAGTGLSLSGTTFSTNLSATQIPNLDATKVTTGKFSTDRIPTLNQNTTGSAAKITTPRAINGTNFDGTAAITTSSWGTTRSIKIGRTAKNVNGSTNIEWALGEVLPSGGTSGNYLRGDGSWGVPTDTTYSAGNGITLTGTTFSVPVTVNGGGNYISDVVQTGGGIEITKATLPTSSYAAGSGLKLTGNTFSVELTATHIPQIPQSRVTSLVSDMSTKYTKPNLTITNIVVPNITSGTIYTNTTSFYRLLTVVITDTTSTTLIEERPNSGHTWGAICGALAPHGTSVPLQTVIPPGGQYRIVGQFGMVAHRTL